MMELFSQWLVSVIATTMVIAVAETLMPKGSVKEVGKLICGLILLLSIIKPVIELSPDVLEGIALPLQDEISQRTEELENDYNQQIKLIIESELATYILDKAKEAGVLSHAVMPNYIAVDCILHEEGIYLPESVVVFGVALDDQDFFRTVIGEDLGIDQIYFKEETHENMENSPNL